MDRIFVDNLRVGCRVGVSTRERSRPQEVLVDVSLFLSLATAGSSGALQDTVNYREVRQEVSRFIAEGEFTLLESVAEGVASLCFQRSQRVERVSVRVRKSKYASRPSIGVEIERTREEGGRWSKRS